ncbi:hypothetical protein [Amphritea sp. HPY]|uniref:hypothetical protein n=1 Tax=Amphritea sp. HPY TaxID=3421652 RepID=UPI003D7EDED5
MTDFDRHPQLESMLDEAVQSKDSKQNILLISQVLSYIQKNNLTLIETNMSLATASAVLNQIGNTEKSMS